MHWNSPWGEGYPGWHIECSAMSMKYLGEQIDIHTGGVDHIKIHHTNEIAQSEGASGKKFVNYWIHTDFLQVNKEKMSKSIGNLYTLENLKENGYSPLSLRYLFMKGDYKKPFDFTWESLFNAQNELVKLWKFFASQNHVLHGKVLKEFKTKFIEGLNDSFNTSKAISVPAVEVLAATPAVRECLKDPARTGELRQHMAEGRAQLGTQTFEQHVHDLAEAGIISAETAKAAMSLGSGPSTSSRRGARQAASA
jgi:cysteinyl-tRNA synthetase